MYQTKAIPYLADGESGSVYSGDAAEVLPTLYVRPQLIVTSPPFDSLRTYGGHGFDFDRMADALVGVMPEGGVLVWVVADATVDGSETGTSFRQALGFMERGLKLHDTMIYRRKGSGGRTWPNRHLSEFEFMFVLARGKPSTVTLIADRPTMYAGERGQYSLRNGATGETDYRGSKKTPPLTPRSNVWTYDAGYNKSHPNYPAAHKHPATFPYALAADHIRTWSNPGDLVLDPMAGSGTVLRAAKDLGRRYVGIEIHEPYCELIRERMAQSVLEMLDN